MSGTEEDYLKWQIFTIFEDYTQAVLKCYAQVSLYF